MFFIKARIIKEALYIKEKEATIRETASNFNIGKSTVHKDMNIRLKKLNYNLYLEVRKVLDKHLATRHLRGGAKTREKYKLLRT